MANDGTEKDVFQLLLAGGRAFLQPGDVGIIWRRFSGEAGAVKNWRPGSRIDPFADLAVAVRKGKTARAVVIARGIINELRLRADRIALHRHIAIVDAVRMFIDKDPKL